MDVRCTKCVSKWDPLPALYSSQSKKEHAEKVLYADYCQYGNPGTKSSFDGCVLRITTEPGSRAF